MKDFVSLTHQIKNLWPYQLFMLLGLHIAGD